MEMFWMILDIFITALRIFVFCWGFVHFLKNDKEKISTLWWGMFVLTIMLSGSVGL